MTSRFRSILWAVCVLAAPCGMVAAQGSATVAGTVVDVTSGAAVVSADILQLGAGRKVKSDSLGKFVFSELPAGIVRLLVRARSFPATLVAVALVKGESLSRVIQLDSTDVGRTAAQRLPPEAVIAARPTAPRYLDFERRRQTGRGQYLTREDLDKGGYDSLQDAMRTLRGVNVECGGGGGCAIRMSRAPMRCSPEYIVDERVDNMFGSSTAIRDIEAVEVYTGPSDVPGEFAGRNAGCGVIVVWTRVGPPRKP
ncbi:MAG: carboxypeptidase regulatory-like domain-containing protein [bacterium]